MKDSTISAIAGLLAALQDLHNGWPMRELHEPPEKLRENMAKALTAEGYSLLENGEIYAAEDTP